MARRPDSQLKKIKTLEIITKNENKMSQLKMSQNLCQKIKNASNSEFRFFIFLEKLV